MVEESSFCVNYNDVMLVVGFCYFSIIGGVFWDNNVFYFILLKIKIKNVSYWERDSDYDIRIGVVEIILIVKDM